MKKEIYNKMSIICQNINISNTHPQKRGRNNNQPMPTNNSSSTSYNQHVNNIDQIKSKN